MALDAIGYQPRGVRLDSGDLGELSKKVRALFHAADAKVGKAVCGALNIVASDDIDEEKLKTLKDKGHEIDTFGIGTHLVTCKKQPALGCVYKLVKVLDNPRIKMSQNEVKITLPDCKKLFRCFDGKGTPLCDVAFLETEADPVPGAKMEVYELVEGSKEYSLTTVTPARVEAMLHKVWDGALVAPIPSVQESKAYCAERVATFFKGVLDVDDPYYFICLSPALRDLTLALRTAASTF